MLRALCLVVSIVASNVGHAHESGCKVLAECNDDVMWKNWPHDQENHEQGYVTESPEETTPGPKLHYYSNTMTWNSGKSFCHRLDRRLCRTDELCTGGRNIQFLFDVIPGDNWVPVSDTSNEWLEIGDSHRRTCFRHGHHYGPPPWGTSNVAKPYKGYIYCCPEGSQEQTKRYQYIGKTATYAKSKRHCVEQGLRLCNISEVCPSNSIPEFGIVQGDMWVAVNDRDNEWVEIGNDRQRTCWIHGPRYGPPPWGIRTDGSETDYVGYVYCCSN